MKKESAHFYLFSTIMSLIMSAGMSLVMLLLSLELDQVVDKFLSTWGSSFLVALPLSLFVVPMTQRVVDKIMRWLPGP